MRMHRRFIVCLLSLLVPLLGPAGSPDVSSAAGKGQGQSLIEPQIAIVWPHDGQGNATPVSASRAVNISLWPGNNGYCDYPLNFRLMRATDNGTTLFSEVEAEPLARTVGGVSFSSLEFNDVPANVADTGRQYRFVAYGEGMPTRQAFHGNVWVHAADARTLQPNHAVPGSFHSGPAPEGYDARIQIVWPHDGAGNPMPVDRATHVNVAVEVFVHGTPNVPLPDEHGAYPFTLRLLAAEGNGPLAVIEKEAVLTMYRLFDGPEWPRWHFNDVPVRAGAQTHFMVSLLVAGARSTSPYSTIWTHAADLRTLLPNPAAPPACV